MLQKIKRFFKKMFSKNFIHPALDGEMSKIIDSKISERKKEQKIVIEEHQATLNSLVRTYFSKKYESEELMKVAFDATNKKWKKLVREVNGQSKLVNLNKAAFENTVKKVITQMKENEAKTKTK